MSTDRELGRIVRNHCRRLGFIGLLVASLFLSASANTITSLPSSQDSADSQQELLASLGVGSGSSVSWSNVNVVVPQGLEAYSDYFPLSIFSGYLNTWQTPQSAQQILVSNLFSSNGWQSLSSDGGDDSAQQLQNMLQEYGLEDLVSPPSKSNALSGSSGGPQVSVTTQTTTTVAAPEPSTLVLFGCATVALSLALANRSSSDSKSDLSGVPDTVEIRWPAEKA